MQHPFAARLLVLNFLSALALGTAAAQVQQTVPDARPPMSSQKLEFNVSSLNGLPVHGEARGLEGLNYSAAVSVSVMDHKSVLHRLFLDHDRHVFFGYDLEAFQVEGSLQVHLHFSPLSDLSSFAGINIGDYRGRDMAVPEDQTVAVNEPVDVPLEIDASGGRVLRDKLTFGPPDSTR